MNYLSNQPENYFTNLTEVTQQSNHILQSNAYKPIKTKLVNIDTKYQSSDTGYGDKNGGAVYNVSLPQRITEIQNISIRCMDVPVSFNNFSQALLNTYFNITYNNIVHTITISDQFISSNSSLISAVNTALTAIDSSLNITLNGKNAVITNAHSSGSVTINFNVDSKGNSDKNNLKNKIGWMLGFRFPQYTINATQSATSESYINLNSIRYLYLALQENPNQGNPNSFVTPLFNSYINKDVLARVAIDTSFFSYGSVIPANLSNGYLVTDKRTYSPGKIALQNMQVQLLTDSGIPVNLNGQDFSFVLEIEHF